ncbi:TonB family protein [Microbulbifer thermotolerans]|uniref:Protein TonB n=1 Tax=Microbulbifer thermotolerans TaxID=252514 RepID=A0A143HJI6_MICTH|nr:TonB family protein [Microbulbifer thermotolerans]AMX01671.1 energy transducer TonB [Microbulbifer thermotolerans]MCX2801247.1 TonB family protein [Microbulbifer thermotolerans]MCX2832442.1 TonB family protein [Microbulbifer thermotolerans]MCX2835995.1 TonB family protein [Microbulbifer thermotolerans]WKT61166.1 TonB family protein [Microbulbifer thermotolerans]
MKPIKLIIALMVFAVALTAKAAPLLNGLALEQQFNKDRYIAAVYSETLADSASALLDNNTPRRLEVRIVADSLSARRFRNQWMEGIAINNSSNVLSSQAENMVTFAKLFSGRYQKGDRLTIDFEAGTGTTKVALNGIALGEIADRDFFNTLLRAWIGPVPPSTDFRDGLLAAGDVPPSLLGNFELLEPSSERIAQLTALLSEEEEEASTEETAVAAAQPAPKAKPNLASDIPPPSLAAASAQPQTPVKEAAPKPAANTPKPQPAKVAATKPTPPPVQELEEEEDEAPLTADLILARQLYHSMLLRHTFKYITYPKRAQERGQEGSVRLNVTIDPQGRVKDVQPLQESRYASLNREAREAVKRASPFPAAPPQLARDNYQFTVPITFRLPN